jgi:hypothetical protein
MEENDMGLIGWYPLNGDIRDYSGNDYHMMAYTIPKTITSAKIGNKGFYFNDNTPIMTINKEILFSEDFTITSWIYLDDAITQLNNNTLRGIVSNFNFNSTDSTFSNISISLNCTSGHSLLLVRFGTVDGLDNTFSSNNLLLSKKWYHISVVYDSKNLKMSIYINGLLDSSINIAKPIRLLPAGITIGQIGIFDMNHNEFIGQISDVRIYNECLSAKNIYKISMAKSLHYTFDNPNSENTTNILYNYYTDCDFEDSTKYISNSDIKFTIVDDTGANNGKCLEIEVLTDKINWNTIIDLLPYVSHQEQVAYTLTLKFKVINCEDNPNGESVHNILSIWSHTLNSSSQVLTYVDYRFWDGNTEGQRSDGWLIRSQTIITPIGTASRIMGMGVGSVKAGTKFRLDWIQYEKKDHSTPFTKFNNRTGGFSDISGFNNDSDRIIDSSPSFSIDTPIGLGSYKFNGNNHITVPNGFISNNDYINQEWTVSVWCKTTDVTKLHQKILNFNLGLYIIYGLSACPLLFLNTSTNNYYRYSSLPIVQNTWYHLVFIFDYQNDRTDIYINGVLANGSKQKIIDTPMIVGIPSIIKIGEGFYGYISDLKIFNKALSSNDVMNLYKSRGYIDNLGNISSTCILEDIINDNLIINGDLSLKDNTNFPTTTFVNGNGPYASKPYYLKTSIGDDEIIATDFIPVNYNDTYCLSGFFRSIGATTFELIDGEYVESSNNESYEQPAIRIKTMDDNFFTTADGYYFSVAPISKIRFGIACYDNNKQLIQGVNVSRYENTFTTLALDLKDGDTTVTLTNSINWNLSESDKMHIGIFDYPEFINYELARKTAPYSLISDNIITLQSAWDSGTIPQGTKVANCISSEKYIYFVADYLDIPTEWIKLQGCISKWINFNGPLNDISKFFYGTSYIKPVISANCSDGAGLSTIYLENITSPQTQYNIGTFSINSNGCALCNEIIEVGRPVRYIRDWVGGNTLDNLNHWVEIQAFNNIGLNIALGKPVSASSTTVYNKNIVTNGSILSTEYITLDENLLENVQIDLGELINITKIKIWHYYLDNRKYHNTKTEISEDGITWYTIFDSEISGEYVETENGKVHYIYNDKFSICDNGYLYANEFIEE